MILDNTTTASPELPIFPFDDAALLQAVSTIIAGILIFLTITPFATRDFKQTVSEIKHRNILIIYMLISLLVARYGSHSLKYRLRDAEPQEVTIEELKLVFNQSHISSSTLTNILNQLISNPKLKSNSIEPQ